MFDELIEVLNEPRLHIGDPSPICPAFPIKDERDATASKGWATMMTCMGLMDDSSTYAKAIPRPFRLLATIILRGRMAKLDMYRNGGFGE